GCGRSRGQYSLYGTALLVLSGAAIAGRRAAQGRPRQGGGRAVPRRARAGAEQRLGALRPQGGGEGGGRFANRGRGGRRLRGELARRSFVPKPAPPLAPPTAPPPPPLLY